MRPHVPLLDRLPGHLAAPLNKLHPDECWMWRGALIGFRPVVKVKGKIRSARRAIYEEMVRPLEKWEKVTAICKDAVCVNPRHVAIKGYETFAPPEIEAIHMDIDESVMSVEDLADLILLIQNHDPEFLAKELCVHIDLIKQALELL